MESVFSINILADASADIKLLLECEMGVHTTSTYDGDTEKGECLGSMVKSVIYWCNTDAWLFSACTI